MVWTWRYRKYFSRTPFFSACRIVVVWFRPAYVKSAAPAQFKERRAKKNVFANGFKELSIVFSQLKQMPVLRRFLLSFFLYSMGVQTVMLVAAGFSKKEIFPNKEDEPKLLFTLILIQLVAIIGAIAMSRLSKRIGNLRVLIIAVLIWIVVCVWAYYIQTQMQFYLLACCVGLIMGGIQSMSRSTYSKFLPETKDTTSFFSFMM